MAMNQEGLGLGIDAGGTQTRWALARADGAIVAEGSVEGLSALQMGNAAGREAVRTRLDALAREVLAHGMPGAVRAGVTGFGDDCAPLAAWLSDLFAVPVQAIVLGSDIDIAYLDSFAPGQGYLVYAGTGSMGAFVASDGSFHRAGGRGVTLDDGGGGFWIAREAMRAIWRREDEHPGAWTGSPMARAVFDHVGGSDWSCSRQFMYGRERGEIGKLALAVAASADHDPEAAAILRAAGVELARLARALSGRFGLRPVVLSGRAAQLHPLIFDTMRASLPAATALRLETTKPHYAAARSAASSHFASTTRP